MMYFVGSFQDWLNLHHSYEFNWVKSMWLSVAYRVWFSLVELMWLWLDLLIEFGNVVES